MLPWPFPTGVVEVVQNRDEVDLSLHSCSTSYPEVASLFGLQIDMIAPTPSALVGKLLKTELHASIIWVDHWIQQLRALGSNGSNKTETSVIHLSSTESPSPKYSSVIVFPVDSEPNQFHFMAVSHKTTQQLQRPVPSPQATTDEQVITAAYKRFFHSSLIPCFISAPNGRVLLANEAWSAETSFTKEDIDAGFNWALSMCPPEVATQYRQELAPQLLSTGVAKSSSVDRIMIHKNGTRFPSEVGIALVKSDESQKEWSPADYRIAYTRNISDRRRFEQDLIKAKQDAQEAVRAKSNFLAAMSHELRTPLIGIIESQSLLLETPLQQDQREFIHATQKAGESLLSLIADILDLSKIEAGKMVLHPTKFEVRQFMEDSVELLSEMINRKGLDIVTLIDPQVPKTIIADDTRIRQIVFNLISNAVKFTEEGGFRLHVSLLPSGLKLRRISLEQDELNEKCHQFSAQTNVPVALDNRGNDGDDQAGETRRILIEVEDTGIGIPDSHKEKMFSSFAQVDSSAAKRREGTGIGLQISKQLATLLGGTLGFTSTFGSGSSFFFDIPFECDEKSSLEEYNMLTAVPQPADPLAGAPICVVKCQHCQPSARMRCSFNQQLHRLPILIHEFASVQEALSALETDSSIGSVLTVCVHGSSPAEASYSDLDFIAANASQKLCERLQVVVSGAPKMLLPLKNDSRIHSYNAFYLPKPSRKSRVRNFLATAHQSSSTPFSPKPVRSPGVVQFDRKSSAASVHSLPSQSPLLTHRHDHGYCEEVAFAAQLDDPFDLKPSSSSASSSSEGSRLATRRCSVDILQDLKSASGRRDSATLILLSDASSAIEEDAELPLASLSSSSPVVVGPLSPPRSYDSELLHTVAASSLHVLVAEDSALLLKVLVRHLEKFGFKVDAVTNGREAIEAQKKYMATNGRGYPIIFSDNMMPEVSGLDAAKIIRSLEHEKGLHAPDQQSFIAILTADVWDDDDFVDGSIDVVLPKPITQQKLEGILKALSERRLK